MPNRENRNNIEFGENMKKIILFTAILIASMAISASAQSEVRVKFAKGKYEKTLSGIVQGRGYIDYVFRANEYEFIEVTLKSANKSVKFSITNSNDSALKKGTEVRRFSGEAGKTGDFRVRVFVGGTSNAKINYKLTISAFQGT
jgi:uncharacterized membrane protein YciS (DUF1049 family)